MVFKFHVCYFVASCCNFSATIPAGPNATSDQPAPKRASAKAKTKAKAKAGAGRVSEASPKTADVIKAELSHGLICLNILLGFALKFFFKIVPQLMLLIRFSPQEGVDIYHNFGFGTSK